MLALTPTKAKDPVVTGRGGREMEPGPSFHKIKHTEMVTAKVLDGMRGAIKQQHRCSMMFWKSLKAKSVSVVSSRKGSHMVPGLSSVFYTKLLSFFFLMA